MFYELNLPTPNIEIIKLCYQVANVCPINFDTLEEMQAVQDKQYNIASGSFVSNLDLEFEVLKQYSRYFSSRFKSTVGVLENTQDTLACYPPHTDRSRLVSIDYYIEQGGSNVKTIMYNQFDSKDNRLGGSMKSYNDVKPLQEYIFEESKWYCTNSRQFRSVENIEHKRILLSLSFYDKHFDQFINDNKHILAGGTGFEPVDA